MMTYLLVGGGKKIFAICIDGLKEKNFACLSIFRLCPRSVGMN